MYVRLLRLDRKLAERQIQSSGLLLGDKRKDLERDYKAMPNPQELSEKEWDARQKLLRKFEQGILFRNQFESSIV